MPTDAQYQQLLRFRTSLRRFDAWSREAAQSHGLTHTQHQLMLAIKGSPTPGGPTIGEVADALLIKPHTATELVDRAQEVDLVERSRDESDSRRVRLQLTVRGAEILDALTLVHLDELSRLGSFLDPPDRAEDRNGGSP